MQKNADFVSRHNLLIGIPKGPHGALLYFVIYLLHCTKNPIFVHGKACPVLVLQTKRSIRYEGKVYQTVKWRMEIFQYLNSEPLSVKAMSTAVIYSSMFEWIFSIYYEHNWRVGVSAASFIFKLFL